jgi:hypothetical protein
VEDKQVLNAKIAKVFAKGREGKSLRYFAEYFASFALNLLVVRKQKGLPVAREASDYGTSDL